MTPLMGMDTQKYRLAMRFACTTIHTMNDVLTSPEEINNGGYPYIFLRSMHSIRVYDPATGEEKTVIEKHNYNDDPFLELYYSMLLSNARIRPPYGKPSMGVQKELCDGRIAVKFTSQTMEQYVEIWDPILDESPQINHTGVTTEDTNTSRHNRQGCCAIS